MWSLKSKNSVKSLKPRFIGRGPTQAVVQILGHLQVHSAHREQVGAQAAHVAREHAHLRAQHAAHALDERAAAAGCSEERMAELLDERAGDLSADSEFGQTIVDLILEDQFFTTE